MLVVMKPDATPQDIEWVPEEIRQWGWGSQA
jgi:hypothetical protein